MLFDKLRRIRRTLAFRLTVWYAGIFTVSSLLAFFFFYLQIVSIVRERTDEELLEELEEFSIHLASRGVDEFKQFLVQEAKDEGEKKIFFRLLNPDGKESASSDLSSWGHLNVNRPALQRITERQARIRNYYC